MRNRKNKKQKSRINPILTTFFTGGLLLIGLFSHSLHKEVQSSFNKKDLIENFGELYEPKIDYNPITQNVEVSINGSKKILVGNITGTHRLDFIITTEYGERLTGKYDKNQKGNGGILKINAKDINSSYIIVKTLCVDIINKGIQGGCYGTGEEIKIIIPNLQNKKIIGIDASFKDDKYDLQISQRYFDSVGTIFYKTQSAGSIPGEGAIRINGNVFPKESNFRGKKYIFFFYDENTIDSISLAEIKYNLELSYSYFDGVIPITYYQMYESLNTHTEDSGNNIRKLLGAIGDCNIRPHTGCNSNLNNYDENDLDPLFTKKMILENSIDGFFILPALLDTIE